MKREELPSIKKTVFGFLAMLLCFAMMFAVSVDAAFVTEDRTIQTRADGANWISDADADGLDSSPNTAPTITLTGSSSVSYTVGAAYSELGATCSDTEDGAITVPAPTFSPALNMAAEGTYTATYTCTDSGSLIDSGTRTVEVGSGVILFAENFDSQPDWTSGLSINNTGAYPVNGAGPDRIQRAGTHTIPDNWYSVRQAPVWAPSLGQPTKHEVIEILASNSLWARGGTGKSMVVWRDGLDDGPNSWVSDAIMSKHFAEGYNELYVEFWIMFGDLWTTTPGATDKIFRVSSWRGDDSEFKGFSTGNLGPMLLWDTQINNYGVRNVISLRGGPHSDNYSFSEGSITGLPRSLNGSGDMSLNFTGDVAGMEKLGADALIPDKLNGGYITSNENIIIEHEQIFGPSGTWTKMAFYVKMNSSPGATDGVLSEWIDDVRILHNTNVPWIRPSTTEDENAKWNTVYFGGNHYFPQYSGVEQREEWYSLDDIVIRTSIPQELQ